MTPRKAARKTNRKQTLKDALKDVNTMEEVTAPSPPPSAAKTPNKTETSATKIMTRSAKKKAEEEEEKKKKAGKKEEEKEEPPKLFPIEDLKAMAAARKEWADDHGAENKKELEALKTDVGKLEGRVDGVEKKQEEQDKVQKQQDKVQKQHGEDIEGMRVCMTAMGAMFVQNRENVAGLVKASEVCVKKLMETNEVNKMTKEKLEEQDEGLKEVREGLANQKGFNKTLLDNQDKMEGKVQKQGQTLDGLGKEVGTQGKKLGKVTEDLQKTKAIGAAKLIEQQCDTKIVVDVLDVTMVKGKRNRDDIDEIRKDVSCLNWWIPVVLLCVSWVAYAVGKDINGIWDAIHEIAGREEL